MHREGAKALATFTEDFFAGGAAETVNAWGLGAAYYVATKLAEKELARVLDRAGARAKVESVLGGGGEGGMWR